MIRLMNRKKKIRKMIRAGRIGFSRSVAALLASAARAWASAGSAVSWAMMASVPAMMPAA